MAAAEMSQQELLEHYATKAKIRSEALSYLNEEKVREISITPVLQDKIEADCVKYGLTLHATEQIVKAHIVAHASRELMGVKPILAKAGAVVKVKENSTEEKVERTYLKTIINGTDDKLNVQIDEVVVGLDVDVNEKEEIPGSTLYERGLDFKLEKLIDYYRALVECVRMGFDAKGLMEIIEKLCNDENLFKPDAKSVIIDNDPPPAYTPFSSTSTASASPEDIAAIDARIANFLSEALPA